MSGKKASGKKDSAARIDLEGLYEKVIAEDMANVEKRHKSLQKNIKRLLSITMDRQIIEKKKEFMQKLLEASDAIGHCLHLAAKIHYPQQTHQLNLPKTGRQASRRRTQEEHSIVPIVVQPQTPQPATSVGFWGGFWDDRMQKKRLKFSSSISDKPVSHTEKVVDELRSLQEVRPLMNRIIDTTFRCLRRYDAHPNRHIQEYLHLAIEDELTKVSTLLTAASTWAGAVQKTESRQVAANIIAMSTRIAEAEASRTVFDIKGSGPVPEQDSLAVKMEIQRRVEEALRRSGQ